MSMKVGGRYIFTVGRSIRDQDEHSDLLFEHGYWCSDCISRTKSAEYSLGGDTSGNHKIHILQYSLNF